MRQPLFGNPWITIDEGILLGLEAKTRFMHWAQRGITTITDIWDETEDD
jgi:hypothetical protein